MLPRILIREDEEVSDLVKTSMEADGVTVLTGHKATSLGKTGKTKWIEVEAGGETRRIAFDDILVAVGRSARLKGYGLEELGIPTGRVIETNEYLETLYPNIYAAGDVAGPFSSPILPAIRPGSPPSTHFSAWSSGSRPITG